MANSPMTLPGSIVLRYRPSRDTSTLPSAFHKNKTNINTNNRDLIIIIIKAREEEEEEEEGIKIK